MVGQGRRTLEHPAFREHPEVQREPSDGLNDAHDVVSGVPVLVVWVVIVGLQSGHNGNGRQHKRPQVRAEKG